MPIVDAVGKAMVAMNVYSLAIRFKFRTVAVIHLWQPQLVMLLKH